MRILVTLLATLLLAAPAASTSATGGKSRVFLSKSEALKLAFPDAEIEHGTVYLTKEQIKRVRKLGSGNDVGAIAHPYTARLKGKIVGTAYFDTHKVRTLKETRTFE